MNEKTLNHCPACGQELTEEPVRGDYRAFTCPTHRRFEISGTAIQMAHNFPVYMEALGRRIEERRRAESSSMIMSNDLTSS